MSLRVVAIRGFGIIAVLKIITATLGRATAIILPLLLLPEDFGVFGIATFFLALVTLLSEFGMGTELVRRKENFREALTVAFTLRFLLSVALTLLLILLAVPVAEIYQDSRLQILMIVLSLSVILNAMNFVPRIIATRRLDFKRAAVPDHIGKATASLVTIGLAFLGFRYWSMAYGLFFGIAAGVVAFMFFVPWRPTLRWRKPLASELLAFGGLVTATRFATLVAHGIDNVIVGYMLGMGPLGIYLLAYTWAVQVPSNIATTYVGVSFPIFSRLRDNVERLRRGYLESIRYYALAVVFIALGILVLARPFVSAVFGETWLPAIVPMQILALSGFLVGLSGLASSVLYAIGHPRSVLMASLAEAAFVVIAVPIAIQRAGLVGASLVSVVGAVMLFVLSQRAVAKHLQVRWRDVGQHFADPIAASLAAVLGVLILQAMLGVSLLSFILFSLSFVGIYAAAMTALTRGRFFRELKELGKATLRRSPSSSVGEAEPPEEEY